MTTHTTTDAETSAAQIAKLAEALRKDIKLSLPQPADAHHFLRQQELLAHVNVYAGHAPSCECCSCKWVGGQLAAYPAIRLAA
jgi:hypothetical protein